MSNNYGSIDDTAQNEDEGKQVTTCGECLSEQKYWLLMFTFQLFITIGTVFFAEDSTASGTKGSTFLSCYIFYTLVEAYRVWATFCVSLLCGCCAPKIKSFLVWMTDSGCDAVGCLLYCLYTRKGSYGVAVFCVCTAIKLGLNLKVWCGELAEEPKPSSSCADLWSKGCGAFIGGANGAMGVAYGFAVFLGAVMDPGAKSVFNSTTFLYLVNIHIFITTTYMFAKMDNIIPTDWLPKKQDWWFPQFREVQPFDILAYFKYEILNLCELILYCLILAIVMFTGSVPTGKGWVKMLGGAAGLGGAVFLSFIMFTLYAMRKYHQNLSPEERKAMSGEKYTGTNDDAYGAPKIMAIA